MEFLITDRRLTKKKEKGVLNMHRQSNENTKSRCFIAINLMETLISTPPLITLKRDFGRIKSLWGCFSMFRLEKKNTLSLKVSNVKRHIDTLVPVVAF